MFSGFQLVALLLAGALALPYIGYPQDSKSTTSKKKKQSSHASIPDGTADPIEIPDTIVPGPRPRTDQDVKVFLSPPKLNQEKFVITTLPPAADPEIALFWFICGGALLSLSTLVTLLLWKPKPVTSPLFLNILDGLAYSLRSLPSQASQAKRMYEDAGKQLLENRSLLESKTSTPAIRSEQALRQQAPVPVDWSRPKVQSTGFDSPPEAASTSGNTPRWKQSPSSRTASGVVGDYQRVCSSSDSQDIDEFEATYHFTRISCLNFEDLRTNPNAILRFQEAQRGSLLLVDQGTQILAFPWFTTSLQQEKERLEGIFQYYERGSANLRLAKPAVLGKQGACWVMQEPGTVQSDE